MFCNGRSGSTYFCNALAGNQQVIYEEEILRRPLFHYPSFVMGKALKNREKWFVMKVKPMHLKRMNLSFDDVYSFVSKHEHFDVHLIRKDYVKQAVSRLVAKKRGLYNTHNTLTLPPLTLQPEQVLAEYSKTKNSVESQLEMLKVYAILTVKYEVDVLPIEGLKKCLLTIYEGLKIGNDITLPANKKVLSGALKDVIENWKEITDYLERNEVNLASPRA